MKNEATFKNLETEKMPPKQQKKKSTGDQVTSRLFSSPKKAVEPPSPRPVQSRQRRRDQKSFISTVEKAADEVLDAEQKNLETNHQKQSQHQSRGSSPSAGGGTLTPVKQLRVETPAIILEKPPGESMRENSSTRIGDGDENDDRSTTTAMSISSENKSKTTNEQGDSNTKMTKDGDRKQSTSTSAVTIPPIPESMKHSSATSPNNTNKKKKEMSGSRRLVTILPAQTAGDDNDNQEEQETVDRQLSLIPSPPSKKTLNNNNNFNNPHFSQSIGNTSKRRNKKITLDGQEQDDDEDDTDPNRFITISMPSPWNRGAISKRVRATSRSMNIYASDDFRNVTDRNSGTLTSKYNKFMLAGTSHEEDIVEQPEIGNNNYNNNNNKKGGGPLLMIRRFDGLDDTDNATLLDINMDGNAKCVSARRPIAGVTGMIPTGTMIAASKTVSSFGEQTDSSPSSSSAKTGNTRRLLQQQQQMKNATQSTESIASARQLLLSGLNPYFGAGAVSDSARDNTGVEYALQQLELRQDPFSVRKRKRLEKYYNAGSNTGRSQYQQQNEDVSEAATGIPTKNSIGASTSRRLSRGSQFFGRRHGGGGHGITEKNAFDTLDTHQARIHVELSNLIRDAKQKTQTKDYLVPSAHAVMGKK